MIDWSLVKFPLLHSPIASGAVQSFNADGELEWTSPKRIQAVGSYDKKISYKSVGGNGQGLATHLWVNGNPSKFLQGHNVLGSDDLRSMLYDVYIILVNQLGIKPTPLELKQVKEGDYELTMVDINYSYSLPSRSDVLAFIRRLEYNSVTRHGRPTTKGGTIYFGKNSERWALKMYCKAEEIQKKDRQLPEPLKGLGLEEWVDNKLRIELRLLSKQLKDLDIKRVKDLPPQKVIELFNQYVRKIEMTEQIKLNSNELLGLPNKLKSTYTLWSEGHDLRSMMSPATYKRHRKELKTFGINIDICAEKRSSRQSNVVTLIRVIEAQPAEIPNWVYEQKLIHHSAKNFKHAG